MPDKTVMRISRADIGAYLILVAATSLYLLPEIATARFVNDDIAVVGLQAMHILRGQWQPFLWSNSYQGAFYPAVAAIAFRIFGTSETTLFATSLVALFIAQGFLFSLLRGRVSRSAALLLCLLTAFVCPAYSLWKFAPRFWCYAIAMTSLWLLNRAPRMRRPLAAFVAAAALSIFDLYVDQFTIFFLPCIVVFGILCAFDSSISGSQTKARLASFMGALIVLGAGWLALRAHVHDGESFGIANSFRQVQNIHLLASQCLPYYLGTSWFDHGIFDAHQPPAVLHVILWISAAIFLGLCVAGFTRVGARGDDGPSRRLALCALTAWVVSAFLFFHSRMTTDALAVRYLAAAMFTAPLAIAPMARKIGARPLAALLAPFLIASVLGGAIDQEYGPQTFRTLSHPDSVNRQARRLGIFLDDHGIKYAVSDYWNTFRLTFLFRERIVFVCIFPHMNFYAPYERGYSNAQKVAFVIPERPGEELFLAVMKRIILANRPYATYSHVGGYTVLVYDRLAGNAKVHG